MSLTSLLASAGIIGPICYWQGRRLSQDSHLVPLAWTPDAQPTYLMMLALAVAWSVLWFIHARRSRRLKLSIAHAALPLALFAAAGWYSSMMSYACNIF